MTKNYSLDERIVLTLDAGGTNFVFSAIQGNKEIVEPKSYPSNADNLEKCIDTIIEGFEKVKSQLTLSPNAISFAFPGPANYELGIIGNLPNFPAFRGGVPLGSILEEQFSLPVFINNDGDLFAYGEALTGYLPALNHKLKETRSIKSFNNLIGITLGTGFGCGIVLNKRLLVGDNSCGAEIHNTINKFNPLWNAEESVSTRAIQRVYADKAGIDFTDALLPKDISDIAMGTKEGNLQAAKTAFEIFGEALGSSIANILTMIDGVVVIGGGLAGSWNLFAPSLFGELNKEYENFRGNKSQRLSYKTFNLEDDSVFNEFALGEVTLIDIPGTHKKIAYDSCPRTGIGLSKLGASKSIALGAYAYALRQLDGRY